MKISLIQSQLAFNRRTLAVTHDILEFYLKERSSASKRCRVEIAESYHKDVVGTRKQIAKLVKLQKALKKDLAREISYERAARVVHSLKISCMANVGETW